MKPSHYPTNLQINAVTALFMSSTQDLFHQNFKYIMSFQGYSL